VDLGELTETLRELVEGSALPVGSTSARSGGVFKKNREGDWKRVQKTKTKTRQPVTSKTWKRKEKSAKILSKGAHVKPQAIDAKTFGRSIARLRGKVKTQAGRTEKPGKSHIWQPNLAVSTKGHPSKD